MKKTYPQISTDNLTKWIYSLIRKNRIIEFYKSTIWKRAREKALSQQNYECQRCKAKGLYNRADTVHHRIPVRVNPSLALTESNLEAICKECHYEEHHKEERTKLNEEKW